MAQDKDHAREQVESQVDLQEKLTPVMTVQRVCENLKQEHTPWKGTMGSGILPILLASTAVIVPMLGLCFSLIIMIHLHRMPDNRSSYLTTSGNMPLGKAFYVNYPAGRLAFISSMSSTVSTLLGSAMMLLFSYPLAKRFTENSDRRVYSSLPSPYQLEILVRLIDGRLTALASFLLYTFNPWRKKIRTVPALYGAFAVMAFLALLVALMTITEFWFHLAIHPAEYVEHKAIPNPIAYAPARTLPASCLNTSKSESNESGTVWTIASSMNGCLYEGVAAMPINQTESISVANNRSDISQLYKTDGYTVLGPSESPDGLEIQATSFASRTSCRTISDFCSLGTSGPQDGLVVCNVTAAGLSLTVDYPTEPVSVYFTDDEKMHPLPPEDLQAMNSTIQLGPYLHWAFIFTKNNTPFMASTVDQANASSNSSEPLLVPSKDSLEVLSCDTNLSDVTFHLLDGTMQILSSRPTSPSPSLLFQAGIQLRPGPSYLSHGISSVAASAPTPRDLASSFAAFADRTLISIPAGILSPAPPTNSSAQTITLVSCVPLAPFIAIITLQLIYVIFGAALTGLALRAVWTGHGIRDSQLRLSSVAALVAECFEDPALGEDASCVDELFAERRGRGTKRVGLELGKREGGRRGRGYVLVEGCGEEEEEEKGEKEKEKEKEKEREGEECESV